MISQARFHAIFSGLSSIARKIYEVVPIATSWTIPQIIAELQRQGISQDGRIAGGCLNTLLLAGLVHEPIKGYFRREAVRPAAPKLIPPKKEIMKPSIAVKAAMVVSDQQNNVDKLGKLAERLMLMAAGMKELAAEISDLAIDIETRQEGDAEDLQKLKTLQSLLKSLG